MASRAHEEMLRILVTGSDGFVGRALAPALAARGHAVRCALMDPLEHSNAHDPEAILALRGLDCAVVGDIGPETQWSEALDGIDTIIHLAGRAHVVRETSPDPMAEFQRVNTAATTRLAHAAADAGVRRMVFVSSIGVHGSVNRGAPFTESSPIAADKDYAVSKWEAECALRDLASSTSFEVVVVRPPLVYGPCVRGNFRRLLDWAYKGWPLPLGGIRNKRTFIALENLVDALALCAIHPDAPGHAFVVGDDASVSTPELIRKLAKHLGRPYRLVPVPEAMLRLPAQMLGRGEDAERILGSLEVDARGIRETLGWRPPVTLDTGLAVMCDWYLKCRSNG